MLNWHTYAQPPSTVLAEARYWGQRADGKLRGPGPAKVMFTESDAWNTGDSQFNYLMERAFTYLLEPRIIANFQYCMEMRNEGGPYCFGVLQPEGSFPPITTTTGPGATCAGGSWKPSSPGPTGRTALRHFQHFTRWQDNYDDRPLRRSSLDGEGLF